jgi:hypothetical protein
VNSQKLKIANSECAVSTVKAPIKVTGSKFKAHFCPKTALKEKKGR